MYSAIGSDLKLEFWRIFHRVEEQGVADIDVAAHGICIGYTLGS